MPPVHIIGAGPAGSAAALAALSEGMPPEISERSRLPRHKVCGEFLACEVACALEELGAWDDFLRAGPASIRRLVLHFSRRERRWSLPQRAFGLSRYRLDSLLFERAIALGARRRPTGAVASTGEPGPTVLACGRKAAAPRGRRLFGFKAHFQGPADDAVELFFFPGGYVGVSPIEQGLTNVCGLAPEDVLRRYGFEPEPLFSAPALADRLRPLTRTMSWLMAGPLVFTRAFDGPAQPKIYPAGDVLGFIDPFTGSGILNALLTGRLAGRAAARGLPSQQYLRHCRRLLARPVEVAALVRAALRNGLAEYLVSFVPARLLYRWTRPAAL